MKAVKLKDFSNVEEATKFLKECFNSETTFEIKPSKECYEVYQKAYEALLESYADSKEKVTAISYWGFACGLNQL